MSGLYIHVPFCVRKCKYCDFFSVPMPTTAESEPVGQPDLLLEALALELAHLPEGFAPETVYIGGGTPTALAPDQLSRLFRGITDHVDLSRVTEWTCEANPGTLTAEKVRILHDAGVNRASLGVQTFNAASLDLLGRIHTADKATAAYRMLVEGGIDNVNLDLMYGIPESSQDDLRRDIDALLAFAPAHIAAYCLTFEAGTVLMELRELGRIEEIDEEEELAQYTLIREALTAAGYEHYEISNFSKPGMACRHNMLYWSGGDYLGCGPSAHSHRQGRRWGNVADIASYCTEILNGKHARDFEEALDAEAKARETLIMSLRRIRGVSRDEFRATTGIDYAALAGDTISDLVSRGLLVDDGDRIRLSEDALFISDTVFRELV